jgi:hypothetical protein
MTLRLTELVLEDRVETPLDTFSTSAEFAFVAKVAADCADLVERAIAGKKERGKGEKRERGDEAFQKG